MGTVSSLKRCRVFGLRCVAPIVDFIHRRVLTSLSVQTYTYMYPKSGCLESLDSFFLLNKQLVMIQMTVAKTHPVKLNGLQEVIDKVKKSNDPKPLLVFLVPPATFKEFVRKQVITTPNKVSRKEKEKNQNKVVQEVWTLFKVDGKDVW